MFKRNNPSATTSLQVDTKGRFFRVFISTPLLQHSSHLGQPVLGIDGTFFTSTMYSGQMLTLNTRDGNGETLLLACAIVHVENASNWHWFLQLCVKSGVSFKDNVVFMDRDKGSQAAVAALIRSGTVMHPRFCTEHIIRNIIAAFKISTADKQFPTLIRNLQGASTMAEHEKLLQMIGDAYGDEVIDYITSINARSWMLFPNMAVYALTDDNQRVDSLLESIEIMEDKEMLHSMIGHPKKMFGCRDTNFVESDNFQLKNDEIRQSEPMDALVKITSKMGRQAYQRSRNVEEFIRKGSIMTPFAEALYKEEVEAAEQCQIHHGTFVGDTIEKIVVEELWNTGMQYIVDVQANTCTCVKFDQIGIPCRHYIQALKEAQRPINVTQVIAKCYLVSTYAEAFKSRKVEPTLLQFVSPLGNILPPPAYKKPAGRPPTRRIRSTGTALTDSTRKPGKSCYFMHVLS